MSDRILMTLLFALLASCFTFSAVAFPSAQDLGQPRVVSHPLPVYPPIAAARKERGVVLIDVEIDRAGKVVSANIFQAPPILGKAARDAASKWSFNEVADATGLRSARLTFVFHPAPNLSNRPSFTRPYRVDIFWDPIVDCFGNCGNEKAKTSGVVQQTTRRPVTPQITGMYTNMRYANGAGDLVGMEIFIADGGDGYYATVQIAEGVPEPPVVVKAMVEGSSIEFTLPTNAGNRFGKFTGRISDRGLSGNFQNSTKTEFLRRRKSYWQ